MDKDLEGVALDIFDIGAIKFGAFRLKLHDTNPDAPLSPFCIDLRLLRTFPPTRKRVAMLMRNHILGDKGIVFDIFADIPTVITPVVTSLSDMTGIGFISPKISKTHGLTGQIDGVYDKGLSVLLIDDLVTSGTSIIEAANVLGNNDLLVRDILVLVDRQQGGEQAIAKAGYKLHSIFKFSQMLQFYLREDLIDQQKYNQVVGYLNHK
ncbi:MAG: hypothetical protein HQ539_03110 [Parcubacteria group bacterium]|nr:hypothetical protein [Parcubacteria group bacterium]